MQFQFKQFLQRLPTTPESPCSYFARRPSRSKAFVSEQSLPPGFFEFILNQGYRRCGTFYYTQSCNGCNLCLSYRLKLSDFKPSRSQRRVLKKNKTIVANFAAPKVSSEKEELYIKYQFAQHFQKPVTGLEPEPFVREKKLDVMYEQMYNTTNGTIELELFDDGKLMAFGILDTDGRSASAVYSVYDPDLYNKSPGTLFILKAIEFSIEKGFEYLHLGYFIPGHAKMSYKSNFRPAEIIDPKSRKWLNADLVLKDFQN